jgi:hypothetical protein
VRACVGAECSACLLWSQSQPEQEAEQISPQGSGSLVGVKVNGGAGERQHVGTNTSLTLPPLSLDFYFVHAAAAELKW